MIVIPIILDSAVDGSRRPLGTLVISNDGAELTGPVRSYEVRHYDANQHMRVGRIEAWPVAKPVLELVAAAIASVLS